MSTTNWTPAQRAAIEDRGGGLLVSAAAGSGKTAVLTERAVRLITDPAKPVDADRLLIVTFTNAAAAELRARIGGKTAAALSREDPSNGWLRRQRVLLQRAPHLHHRRILSGPCCGATLKLWTSPPDFIPADAGSVQMLREAALADTLECACQDPDFCAFADLYGKGPQRRRGGAGPSCRSTISLRALPDYDREIDRMLEPWQRGKQLPRIPVARSAAGTGRPGGRRQPADCWMPPGPTASWTWRRSGPGRKKAKRPAAARAAAAAKVNDRFAEPLERAGDRPDAAAAGGKRWPGERAWEPSVRPADPLCAGGGGRCPPGSRG